MEKWWIKKKKERKIVHYGSTSDGRSVTEYDDGTKKIKMNEEGTALIKAQLEFFKEKFGREPTKNDPVFFDPDCDVPTPISEEKITKLTSQAMVQAGCDREQIYAYIKTGLLLSETNIELVSPTDIEDWNTAIDEYNSNPIAGESFIKNNL